MTNLVDKLSSRWGSPYRIINTAPEGHYGPEEDNRPDRAVLSQKTTCHVNDVMMPKSPMDQLNSDYINKYIRIYITGYSIPGGELPYGADLDLYILVR